MRARPTLSGQELGVVALGSLAGVVVLAWIAFGGSGIVKLSDFRQEAWPAYHALAEGHLIRFLQLGPPYVGSLVMRAPFALPPAIWGGSVRATYFASGIPCVVAAPILGVWLQRQPWATGAANGRRRLSPIVLSIFSPFVFVAVLLGHPEDILGTVLCIAGVVQAANGKVRWSALLIGLAVVNKPWAGVAVPVALVAMPKDQRRKMLIMIVAACAVLIPAVIIHEGGLSASGAGNALGTGVGTIFTVPQLLWWFGRNSWIVHNSHVIIGLVAVGCAVAYWIRWDVRSREQRTVHDALMLLALVFLLRAALDPIDNDYYHVPFLFALMAYEVGRPARLTVSYTILLLLVVPAVGFLHLSKDGHAAAYAAVVIPTIAWLAARVYLATQTWQRLVRVRGRVPLAASAR